MLDAVRDRSRALLMEVASGAPSVRLMGAQLTYDGAMRILPIAALLCLSRAAFADVPPPPGYVEQCTVENSAKGRRRRRLRRLAR